MSGRHTSANVATVIISVCAPRQKASAEGRSKRIAIRHLRQQPREREQPEHQQRILHAACGDLDTAKPDDTAAGHGNDDDEKRIGAISPIRTSRTREERLLLSARLAEHANHMPRCERVCNGEDSEIHDVVVRGVRAHGHAQTAADCRVDTAVPQRPSKPQREQREDPCGQQIEMSEQMRRDIRRAAERDAGEERERGVHGPCRTPVRTRTRRSGTPRR